MVGEGHWAGEGQVLLVSGSSLRMGGGLEGGWRQANLIMMVQGERTVMAGAVVGGWRAGVALERDFGGRISKVESLWTLVEKQREVLCLGDDEVTGSVWVRAQCEGLWDTQGEAAPEQVETRICCTESGQGRQLGRYQGRAGS